MTDGKNSEDQGMPFWKAFLVAIVAMVVIVGWVMLGQLVFNLHNPWVGLIALTVFGALYKGNIADAPKVWIGSAAALLIAYLLWSVPKIPGVGPAGALVGLIVIILCLGAVMANKFPLVCNQAMLIMLTVSTASSQIMKEQQHLMYLQDLVYGALCFWFMPLLIVKIKEKKVTNQ